MAFSLGIVYCVVTGAVLISMAVLFLRGQRTRSTGIYLVCQGTVALWCLSQVMHLLATNQLQLNISYLVGNIGICFIAATWYLFAGYYTGHMLKGWMKYLPMVTAVFHYGMVLTNNWHHLYYKSFTAEGIVHGPLFYSNVVITYFWVLAGAYLLYRYVREERTLARRLVVASVLIPTALNGIYLSGLVRASFDITPLGFGISVVLVMLATTKYQFIDFKRELAITNEKLLLEMERNRIAQQVHDTAGHTLTMIQSYMKLAAISAEKEQYEEVNSYLTEARGLTSQGIRELRESINMLRQEAEYELVTQGVMQLAGQVKEIPVEVTVKGEDSEKYSHLSKPIYDTVRESITNTLKYAQATRMDIIIRFQDSAVEVMIADDGKGCDIITDNNGLKGIRERIEKAGGTVRFSSGEGEGFLTRVKLPVK